MIAIILFSALLSPIITSGLYCFFAAPHTNPKHRKGL